MERIRVNFCISRAYSTKVSIKITYNDNKAAVELKFLIPYNERNFNEDRIIAARARFWEPEAEMRIETQSSSAWLYRSGIKMVVSKIEMDECENIMLTTRMDDDQVRMAREKAPRLMDYQETNGIVIYPDMDNTGYETAVRDFSGSRLTTALTDPDHGRRPDILQRMMRLEEETEDMEVDLMEGPGRRRRTERNTEMEMTGLTRQLTGEQAEILRLLEDKSLNHLVVQAPAGTGKT